MKQILCCGILAALVGLTGCQKAEQSSPGPISKATEASPAPGAAADAIDAAPEPERSVPSISLSGSAPPQNSRLSTNGSPSSIPSDESRHSRGDHRRVVLEKMKPLQVMLGDWHGTTQKEFGDFKALDKPHWVWDFLTDKNQPALVMTSAESPYFRSARLTFLSDQDVYRLETVDAGGNSRTFEGTFSQPVEEFQGDDRRMHRRYKLQLTQTDAGSPRDAWQVVFNQQDNNRYLVELSKRRSSGFLRFDTIATQRDGTSFAKSDQGYGERECIISGGLGTIQVSYQGRTYYVCCTGCKAAFEEDPSSWIAEYESKKKE